MSGTGSTRLKWGDLARAVAEASFSTDGVGRAGELSADDPAGAAAMSVVDQAITAIEQRRRTGTRARSTGPGGAGPVPLDADLFDQQTLGDLLEFLRHARRGMLTAGELAEEAALWKELLRAGWPPEATDHVVVAHAVGLLAVVPVAATPPSPPRRVEPANDIERAVAAVAADERARPRLWRAIWEGDVVIPVVAYELVRPEGANLQFLTVPVPDAPLVLGFGTEERFDAMLPPDMPYSRVLAPGRDLPKIWPAGHWLMINGGYEHHAVLSPSEIAGLPDGGRSELPQPRAVDIEGPGDDPRSALLEALVADAGAGVVAQVHWARVRSRAQLAAGHRSPRWQDVLVVGASEATDATGEAAAVQALRAALPEADFPGALVVGRQAAMAHPFIEAVVAVARPLIGGPAGEPRGEE